MSDISGILADLLDLPESERDSYIDQVAGADKSLRDELNELLSSFKEATGFFTDLADGLGLPGATEPTTNPASETVTQDPSAMIGREFAQYRIVGYLGGGGMGMVYKAEDTKLGRFAALKFLPLSLGNDATARERFLREARAASVLDHPNICTVYEIGDERGQSYISMAFYEGQTIEKLISRGPLDVDLTVQISSEMCSGLSVAHAKGIVHRDMKPANVIVTDGVTKILDFGLAKSENSAVMTQEGAVLGTAAYMSPEQATGKDVDHRTDIWSTGAMIYEMLTGERPFPGAYPQAILYGILNTEPEPLSALRPGLPMQLVQLVERALTKKVDQRYSNMAEMMADLKAVSERQTAKSAARNLVANVQEPNAPTAVMPAVDDDVLHILCVDDEPELELLMQQRFRKKIRAGEWKFVFALDGMEALQKLEKHPDIGVILTDLNMPRMDGLTLLEKLAELDRPTRTVVVSAYGDMEKIRTAMNRGAFDFVTKPVNFQDLETTTLKAANDLAEYRRALRGQQQAVSIQQEIDVARRIQDAIIPVTFPSSSTLQMYGFSAPAADVSGTFYDAFDMEDGKVGMLMGDVGGRGVTAALLMAMGQTFVKSFMQQGVRPSECLTQLNTMLFADGLPNVGLKMVAAVLDTATGELDMANAGHEAAFILRADGALDTIDSGGSSVWQDASFELKPTSGSLASGDALVLLSAGMINTRSSTGSKYSRERMASTLREAGEAGDAKPTSLIRHLVRAVQDHAGNMDPREDLTILAARRV